MKRKVREPAAWSSEQSIHRSFETPILADSLVLTREPTPAVQVASRRHDSSTMPSTRHPRRTSRPRRVTERLLALVPVALALATLGVGLLAASNGALDGALWLLVVGWVLLSPLSALLLWDVDLPAVDPRWARGPATEDASTTDGPVATLRERFARGEIDHEEFERRLDDLLGSAADAASEAGGGTDVEADARAPLDANADAGLDDHDRDDRDDAVEFEFSG
jgi:uncharacterized membrane protein